MILLFIVPILPNYLTSFDNIKSGITTMTCFDYNRKERIKEFLLPNSASVYIRANIRAILPIRADLNIHSCQFDSGSKEELVHSALVTHTRRCRGALTYFIS